MQTLCMEGTVLTLIGVLGMRLPPYPPTEAALPKYILDDCFAIASI